MLRKVLGKVKAIADTPDRKDANADGNLLVRLARAENDGTLDLAAVQSLQRVPPAQAKNLLENLWKRGKKVRGKPSSDLLEIFDLCSAAVLAPESKSREGIVDLSAQFFVTQLLTAAGPPPKETSENQDPEVVCETLALWARVLPQKDKKAGELATQAKARIGEVASSSTEIVLAPKKKKKGHSAADWMNLLEAQLTGIPDTRAMAALTRAAAADEQLSSLLVLAAKAQAETSTGSLTPFERLIDATLGAFGGDLCDEVQRSMVVALDRVVASSDSKEPKKMLVGNATEKAQKITEQMLDFIQQWAGQPQQGGVLIVAKAMSNLQDSIKGTNTQGKSPTGSDDSDSDDDLALAVGSQTAGTTQPPMSTGERCAFRFIQKAVSSSCAASKIKSSWLSDVLPLVLGAISGDAAQPSTNLGADLEASLKSMGAKLRPKVRVVLREMAKLAKSKENLTSAAFVQRQIIRDTRKLHPLADSKKGKAKDEEEDEEETRPKLTDLAQQKLQEVFETIDTNKDGLITKAEMIKTLRTRPQIASFLGLPSQIRQGDGSREYMEMFFQKMDLDDSGTLSCDEWHSYWTKELLEEAAGEENEENEHAAIEDEEESSEEDLADVGAAIGRGRGKGGKGAGGRGSERRGTMEAYEVLGATGEDDAATLRQKYHKSMKANHPDKGGDHEDFIQVQAAADKLAGRRSSFAEAIGRAPKNSDSQTTAPERGQGKGGGKSKGARGTRQKNIITGNSMEDLMGVAGAGAGPDPEEEVEARAAEEAAVSFLQYLYEEIQGFSGGYVSRWAMYELLRAAPIMEGCFGLPDDYVDEVANAEGLISDDPVELEEFLMHFLRIKESQLLRGLALHSLPNFGPEQVQRAPPLMDGPDSLRADSQGEANAEPIADDDSTALRGRADSDAIAATGPSVEDGTLDEVEEAKVPSQNKVVTRNRSKVQQSEKTDEQGTQPKTKTPLFAKSRMQSVASDGSQSQPPEEKMSDNTNLVNESIEMTAPEQTPTAADAAASPPVVTAAAPAPTAAPPVAPASAVLLAPPNHEPQPAALQSLLPAPPDKQSASVSVTVPAPPDTQSASVPVMVPVQAPVQAQSPRELVPVQPPAPPINVLAPLPPSDSEMPVPVQPQPPLNSVPTQIQSSHNTVVSGSKAPIRNLPKPETPPPVPCEALDAISVTPSTVQTESTGQRSEHSDSPLTVSKPEPQATSKSVHRLSSDAVWETLTQPSTAPPVASKPTDSGPPLASDAQARNSLNLPDVQKSAEGVRVPGPPPPLPGPPPIPPVTDITVLGTAPAEPTDAQKESKKGPFHASSSAATVPVPQGMQSRAPPALPPFPALSDRGSISSAEVESHPAASASSSPGGWQDLSTGLPQNPSPRHIRPDNVPPLDIGRVEEMKEEEQEEDEGVGQVLSNAAVEMLQTVFQHCDEQSTGSIKRRDLLKLCQMSTEVASFFGFSHGTEEEQSFIEFLVDPKGSPQLTWEEFVTLYVQTVGLTGNSEQSSDSPETGEPHNQEMRNASLSKDAPAMFKPTLQQFDAHAQRDSLVLRAIDVLDADSQITKASTSESGVKPKIEIDEMKEQMAVLVNEVRGLKKHTEELEGERAQLLDKISELSNVQRSLPQNSGNGLDAENEDPHKSYWQDSWWWESSGQGCPRAWHWAPHRFWTASRAALSHSNWQRQPWNEDESYAFYPPPRFGMAPQKPNDFPSLAPGFFGAPLVNLSFGDQEGTRSRAGQNYGEWNNVSFDAGRPMGQAMPARPITLGDVQPAMQAQQQAAAQTGQVSQGMPQLEVSGTQQATAQDMQQMVEQAVKQALQNLVPPMVATSGTASPALQAGAQTAEVKEKAPDQDADDNDIRAAVLETSKLVRELRAARQSRDVIADEGEIRSALAETGKLTNELRAARHTLSIEVHTACKMFQDAQRSYLSSPNRIASPPQFLASDHDSTSSWHPLVQQHSQLSAMQQSQLGAMQHSQVGVMQHNKLGGAPPRDTRQVSPFSVQSSFSKSFLPELPSQLPSQSFVPELPSQLPAQARDVGGSNSIWREGLQAMGIPVQGHKRRTQVTPVRSSGRQVVPQPAQQPMSSMFSRRLDALDHKLSSLDMHLLDISDHESGSPLNQRPRDSSHSRRR